MATIQEQSSHTRTVDELGRAAYQCMVERFGASEVFHKALPDDQRGQRTDHELDYADFAVVVGLAYGIARGEDPYEPAESVTARAGAAATMAYEQWGKWDVSYAADRAARPVPDSYQELTS